MTPLQRWLLHASTILLTATGVAYAVMKYLMEPADPFSAVSHPLQPWMMTGHVLVAPLAVFAVGAIFRDHILAKMRARNARNGHGNGVERATRKPRAEDAGRATGIAATLVLGPLIASGYLLQAATGEFIRQAFIVSHIALGLAYAALYLGHLVRSRAAAGTDGRSGGERRDGPRVVAPVHRAVG